MGDASCTFDEGFPAVAEEAAPDRGRIAAVVGEHVAFVWRLLRRFGVPPSDVEDAAQRVFIVASAKLDQIEPGRERSFLAATAVRVASAVRRDAKRRPEIATSNLDDQLAAGPSPDEEAESREALVLLDRILDAMPDELRIVLVLCDVEQLTAPEVAALQRAPVGTISSRLRRAQGARRGNQASSGQKPARRLFMNHPRSVLEREPNEVASLMMTSARGEQPPAQLRRHVITAIGGAGALGTAVSAASATAAATAIAGTTATSAKLLMAASLVPAVKWGVVGMAAGLLTLGVSERARDLDRPSDGSIDAPVISAPDRNPSKLAPVEPEDRALVPGAIATPTAGEGRPLTSPSGETSTPPDGPSMVLGDPLRSKLATGGAKPRVRASNVTDVARQLERADETAAAPASTAPPLAAPEGAPRPSLGSLGAEVALLDDARSALAGHDPARTLRTIESYERTFPAGRLLTEATALRIEALVANHEPAVAKAIGQRFLAANPRGPLAERVRRLLTSSSE